MRAYIKTPCFDCQDKVPNCLCQKDCETYKRYFEKLTAARKDGDRNQDYSQYVFDMKYKTNKRINREK